MNEKSKRVGEGYSVGTNGSLNSYHGLYISRQKARERESNANGKPLGRV